LTLSSALSISSDTNLPLDTVFKVQDLADSIDLMGSVALNMSFAL